MRFHGDLTQASPVIRETHVYDSGTGLTAGCAVSTVAINASEGKGGCVLTTYNTVVDILGVLTGTPASQISVMAAGTEYFGKVIVNPMAYYLAEWVDGQTNTITVASTTGESIEDTSVDATNEGAWVYITAGAGIGNLFKAGAQTSTTVLTNVTGADYDDELKANAVGDLYMLIRAPYVGAPTLGSINLNSAATKLEAGIANTGPAIVLENYINSKRFPMEPLRTKDHGGKNVSGAKFYGDLYFSDHILRGAITLP